MSDMNDRAVPRFSGPFHLCLIRGYDPVVIKIPPEQPHTAASIHAEAPSKTIEKKMQKKREGETVNKRREQGPGGADARHDHAREH